VDFYYRRAGDWICEFLLSPWTWMQSPIFVNPSLYEFVNRMRIMYDVALHPGRRGVSLCAFALQCVAVESCRTPAVQMVAWHRLT
jgi:hypothetical protein